MLEVIVPDAELFDDESQTFFTREGGRLVLEHSLVSLSKWESKWEKPFLDGTPKTTEQTQSYVECMCLHPVSDPEIFKKLSDENVKQIADYIDSKQTATWFTPDPHAAPSREIITNEIIYFWMVGHSIPMEAQYWHLNKLMTLLRVCSEKNKPATKSKLGKQDLAMQRRMLNQQRKAELNTTG